ncbi:MAG: hypothetical protein ABIL44_07840 [candidate division WOR-3 bacterium]
MQGIFVRIILPVLFGIMASLVASYLWWELHFSKMVPKIETIDLTDDIISIKPRGKIIDVQVRGVLLGNVIKPEETWKFFYDKRPLDVIPVPKLIVPLSVDYFYCISNIGERGEPSEARVHLKLTDENFLKRVCDNLKDYNKAIALKHKISEALAGKNSITIYDFLEVFDFLKVEVIGSHERTGLRAYFSEKFPQDRM